MPQEEIKIISAHVVHGFSENVVKVLGTSAEVKKDLISSMYAISVDNRNFTVKETNKQEISEAVVKQFSRDNFGTSKGIFTIANYKVYTLANGTNVLTSDVSREFSTDKNVYHLKGSILIGLFDAMGNISAGCIPKRQSYGGELANNFFVHHGGDKLHLVYTIVLRT